MIHVFIDTSALPRHPAHLGAAFKRLCQLVNNGLVEIHLSTVVTKEWESQFAEEFAQLVEKAKVPMERLLRHPWAERIHGYKTARRVAARLGDARINQIVTSRFKALLREMRADILPIGAHHGQSVVDGYFAGSFPFEKPKNREDFPDAFVFQCAKDLAIQLDAELDCIIADKNLREKITQLDSMRVYQSINDFVQSEVVANLVGQQQVEQMWQAIFVQLSGQLPKQAEELMGELEVLAADKLAFTRISHPQIPDDNSEAFITGVYEPIEVKFQWDNIRNFGPGLITLPVAFECKAEIEFSVYRGDAYDVPPGVWVEEKDPEEYHYFDAGGSVQLAVRCTLSLQFNIEGNEENPPALNKVNILVTRQFQE